MLQEKLAIEFDACALIDEQTWYDLYFWLLPLVEMWVRTARVSAWSGQYEEVAQDIALEALTRTFRYYQRSHSGTLPPIGSLHALCKVIARNYFRDVRKKDWYLVRPNQESSDYTFHDIFVSTNNVDASEIALDHLILDAVMTMVARVVVKFPPGQKTALLADLARISDLDGEVSSLEQALSDVGVKLSDYRRPQSSDPAARGRDAALRSIAYKRLKREVKF
jgi:hypothetical protein